MPGRGKKAANKKKSKGKGKRNKQVSDYERVSGWDIEAAERASRQSALGLQPKADFGRSAPARGQKAKARATGDGSGYQRRSNQLTQEQERRRRVRKRAIERFDEQEAILTENKRRKKQEKLASHREIFGIRQKVQQVHPGRVLTWGVSGTDASHSEQVGTSVGASARNGSRLRRRRNKVVNKARTAATNTASNGLGRFHERGQNAMRRAIRDGGAAVPDDNCGRGRDLAWAAEDSEGSDEIATEDDEATEQNNGNSHDLHATFLASLKSTQSRGVIQQRSAAAALLAKRAREQAGEEDVFEEDEEEEEEVMDENARRVGNEDNDDILDPDQLKELGFTEQEVREALRVHRQGLKEDEEEEDENVEEDGEADDDDDDVEAEDEKYGGDDSLNEKDENQEKSEQDRHEADFATDETDEDEGQSSDDISGHNHAWHRHFSREPLSNDLMAKLKASSAHSIAFRDADVITTDNTGVAVRDDSDEDEGEDEDSKHKPAFKLKFSFASASGDASGNATLASIKSFGKQAKMARDCGIVPALANQWSQYREAENGSLSPSLGKDPLLASAMSPLQRCLMPALQSCCDLYFGARACDSNGGESGNGLQLRELYVLHIMQHVLRSRGAVRRHDARLAVRARRVAELKRAARAASMQLSAAKETATTASATVEAEEQAEVAASGKKAKKSAREKVVAARKLAAQASMQVDEAASASAQANEAAAAAAADAEVPPDTYRDQGFTRPTVLLLLPTRCVALRVVQLMRRLLPTNFSEVANEERFDEDFGISDDEDEAGAEENEGEEDDDNPAAKAARRERQRQTRQRQWRKSLPADWRELFDGNADDDFRIGLSFGKRTLKLYADFERSDVVIASPLGLRRTIGSEGEREHASGGEADASFLSSIELLVLDHADAFRMQNWQHIVDVMNVLNRTPRTPGATDFARVRNWALQGQQRCFRQTLVFAAHIDPLVTAALREHCCNFDGILRVRRRRYGGAVARVLVPTRQLFRRLPDSSLAQAPDVRFEYFRDQVFKKIESEQLGRTLVFFADYFDYVRARNLLHKSDVVFAPLCEYTETGDVSRTRAHFYHGNIDVLLFTERFHYFKRYNLRGIRHIVFYGVPHYAGFYTHMLNLLEEATESQHATSCSVLYSRFDANEMERVVGTSRWRRMIRSQQTTHVLASS